MADANKQKRYDRQIRIWGAEGQQRLESARVTLLNCSPTGSETLKNLVLGGIASFTIIDGQKVTARDLGNNFLVASDSLGQPRAKVVTDLLKELNESVKGCYIEDTPESVIENNPGLLEKCDLLVATQASGCPHPQQLGRRQRQEQQGQLCSRGSAVQQQYAHAARQPSACTGSMCTAPWKPRLCSPCRMAPSIPLAGA
jgi:hypothetical protein